MIPEADTDAAALALVTDPSQTVPGNDVRLLVGGDEAYPQMLDAIAGAKNKVWLEVYAFADDRVGRLFAEALLERARAGVDVRVCVDGLGAVATGRLLDELRAGAVKVRAVFTLAPWQRAWRWLTRDHRKLLIIDDGVAFTGGLNIGLEYAGPRYGGQGWHDLQLAVRGPAVRVLARLFASVWRRNGGGTIAEPADTARAGEHAVRVLANHVGHSRKEIRRAYFHAFRRAKKSIVIANAYFLPGPRMMGTLIRAARRGVEVVLILPGVSDHLSFQLASRARYPRLLSAGGRIYELCGSMLHAKAAVVDGMWCTVGSCNLDAWSLRRNLELNVAVVGPSMSSVVEAHLRGLLARCTELTLEECRSWSLGYRLLQLLCLLLFTFW
jgi:cardiolipin synthase